MNTVNYKTAYCAIFAISFASLLFETALTRVAAFIIYQDFVYFSISAAVCGVGIGAALSSKILRNASDDTLYFELPIIFAILTLLSLLLIPFLPSSDPIIMWMYFSLAATAPFLIHGMFISAILTKNSGKSGTIYAIDLIGAGLGALIAVPIMNFFSPVGTVIICAAAPMLAAVGIAPKRSQKLITSLIAIAILSVSALFFSSNYFDKLLLFRNVPGKGLFLEYSSTKSGIIETKWDAFGRIDVTEPISEIPYRLIYTDGSIPAMEFNYTIDTSKTNRYLTKFAGFLPFTYGNCDSVLSIGTGGGLDCHLFRIGGGKHLTAIELNSSMINYVQRNAAYNGNVYSFPGITLEIDEGRRFIESTDFRFDIILLMLAQGNHAEAGGRVLSENYLLTKEAFRSYHKLLKKGGRITIAVHNPHRASRHIMTWAEMLREQGIPLGQAIRQTTMLSYPDNAYRFILMFWKEVPDSAAVYSVKTFADTTPANAIYIPFIREDDRDLGGMANGTLDAETFINTSPGSIPISPASDDKPFQNDVFPGLHPLLKKMLTMIIILLAFIAIITFYQTRNNMTAMLNIPFFILIGSGYMAYEILLLHRMMLYLGHPTLSLSIVISTMLLSSGTASWISGKYYSTPAIFKKLLFILPVYILSTLPMLDTIMKCKIAEVMFFRLLAAIVLTAIPGFLMGFFMPHGLTCIKKHDNSINSMSWYYGLNGIASVAGSLAIMSMATLYGLQASLTATSAVYSTALLLLYITDHTTTGKSI